MNTHAPRFALRLPLLLSLAALLAGCGETIDVGGFGGSGGEGGGDGGAGGGAGGESAAIAIRLRASAAPFEHADGFAGQTPIAFESGIRSLVLLRDENDPAPVTVFDLGQDAVATRYEDGADTLVYTARARDLPAATFTIARVVHAWTRYEVAGTMHNGALSAPGTFQNFQVLSDGTLVDGTVRDAGYYEYVFATNGMSFPTSGTNAPTPEYEGTGGFSVRVEDGEYAFYFPVNLPVDPSVPTDLAVVLDVNVHEAFRWQDQDQAGYEVGVFDTTPTSFEPVMQLGANSFALTLE